MNDGVVPKLDIGGRIGERTHRHLNRDHVQGTHPLFKPGSPKLVHASLASRVQCAYTQYKYFTYLLLS